MSTVGIRELKAHLSAWLRKVKRGETVRVTDRGKVVAEIRKPRGAAKLDPESAALQRLVAQGLVREGGPNDPSLYAGPVARCPPGTVQRILDELREDRC